MPILVLTQANKDFIKANRLLISGAAMAKKIGVSKSAVNCYMRKNGLTASKELSNKFKGIASQKPFTPDEDKYIIENIEKKSIKQIGKHLKRTSQYISKRCREIGLGNILDAKAEASKYTIGSIPKNKGEKQTEYMSAEAIERTKATRFVAGQNPHNALPDGTIVERIDKRSNTKYQLIKVPGKRKLVDRKRHIWETDVGPIPKGYFVVFKTSNTENYSIENIECISPQEHLSRNQIHHYPTELKEVIKLKNKIKKTIYEQQKRTTTTKQVNP